MTTSGTEGVSAVWIFANISFTGMRAQAKRVNVLESGDLHFGIPRHPSHIDDRRQGE
jgi:hypothetical protein